MSLSAGISERIGALVHDSARRDGAENLRHVTFIAGRLFLALVALIALPMYLALHGAPAPADALVFALVLGPIVAVTVTARTGGLLTGQIICIVSWLLAATVLSLGPPPVATVALVWFALAPMEAYLTGRRRIVIATGAAALTLAAAVVLIRLLGWSGTGAAEMRGDAVLMVALAIAYATILAFSSVRLNELYRRAAAIRRVRYHSLAEAIGDCVLQMDKSGAVSFLSGNCENLFGLSTREFIGRGLFDRIHVADRPAFLKAITDAAIGGCVVTAVLRIRVPATTDNEHGVQHAWIEIRANRMQLAASEDASDGVDGVIAVMRDITDKVEREQALDMARKEAERANLWKDRFVANVSHELRTPLNAIIGFAEILGNKDIAPVDPEKTREYANIIHKSGEHLLTVVNSILDISKIEAGSFDILPEAFELPSLVDNCMDMLRLRAETGRVALMKDVHPEVSEIVADKRSVRQILINLVSNAIKFTPEGGAVTVGLQPAGNSIALTVRDTGIGIFEAELPKLGVPFFQASDNYDRDYEGTGLGLSVVRGLVGLHGGAIRIESAPGAGTLVRIKLPLDCRQIAHVDRAPAVIEVLPSRAQVGAPAAVDTIGVRKIA